MSAAGAGGVHTGGCLATWPWPCSSTLGAPAKRRVGNPARRPRRQVAGARSAGARSRPRSESSATCSPRLPGSGSPRAVRRKSGRVEPRYRVARGLLLFSHSEIRSRLARSLAPRRVRGGPRAAQSATGRRQRAGEKRRHREWLAGCWPRRRYRKYVRGAYIESKIGHAISGEFFLSVSLSHISRPFCSKIVSCCAHCIYYNSNVNKVY